MIMMSDTAMNEKMIAVMITILMANAVKEQHVVANVEILMKMKDLDVTLDVMPHKVMSHGSTVKKKMSAASVHVNCAKKKKTLREN